VEPTRSQPPLQLQTLHPRQHCRLAQRCTAAPLQLLLPLLLHLLLQPAGWLPHLPGEALQGQQDAAAGALDGT
jgi:hypothetical protein